MHDKISSRRKERACRNKFKIMSNTESRNMHFDHIGTIEKCHFSPLLFPNKRRENFPKTTLI